jgi:hypothetical protein
MASSPVSNTALSASLPFAIQPDLGKHQQLLNMELHA